MYFQNDKFCSQVTMYIRFSNNNDYFLQNAVGDYSGKQGW